jgi:hypothetical protein
VTRHADGNVNKSIDINEKRFAMSEQLAAIFRNTARSPRRAGTRPTCSTTYGLTTSGAPSAVYVTIFAP